MQSLFRVVSGVVLLLVAGCATTDSGRDHEPVPLRSQVVSNWRLPPAAAISVRKLDSLRDQSDGGVAALRADLANGPTRARIGAAHAIEKLGGRPGLTEQLCRALREDNDPLARVFICRALAASGASDEVSLTAMREIYRHTEHPIVRTYAAGALVVSAKPSGSQNELQHLLDQLDPRARPPQDEAAAQAFWESRWAAAYMIGRLGAEGKPLASAIERSTEVLLMPAWVERQLFLTLRDLSRTR